MRALQLAPNNPDTHSFYARWLVEEGLSGEAIPHLQQAVALSPAYVAARHQLLDAYAKAGRTAEMKVLALETLLLAPGDPLVTRFLNRRNDTPMSQPEVGDVQTAAGMLNTSLRLHQSGDFRGSIDAARKALELERDYAEAHNNIAANLASLRQWDEAIAEAREALRLEPDFPLAKNNLRWAENEKERTSPNRSSR